MNCLSSVGAQHDDANEKKERKEIQQTCGINEGSGEELVDIASTSTKNRGGTPK